MTSRRIAIYLVLITGLFAAMLGWYAFAFAHAQPRSAAAFEGERAYADVKTQVAFGPRVPGSAAHAHAVEWIKQQLESAGWSVEIQQAERMGHPVVNIRAYRGTADPQVLLAAHYDSRIQASLDPDPAKRTQPVPGADDGASGVAVLLELARTLPEDAAPVWLAFLDAEDNGNIPGWDWSLGAQAFVAGMKVKPRSMVLLDMVGDSDLSIPWEDNSDPVLRQSIWNTAAQLGYGDVFVQHSAGAIIDDHLEFINAGIPSVDIIDIKYRYWHTASDLPEHVSPRSLQVVGDVMLAWLEARPK